MSAYSNMIRADSPAAYWPLNETSGTNADEVIGGSDGTCQGGLTMGGASGPLASETNVAPNLDGSNDYISTSYAPFVNGTVRTFEGWGYRDTDTTLDVLVGSASASTPFRLQIRSAESGRIQLRPQNSAIAFWDTAWPGQSQWVHFALTFDESGDTATLYINGVSKGAKAMTDAYSSPGNFQAGAAGSGSDPFDGRLAHFAIYNRALTLSEIQGHYIAGLAALNKPRFIHEAGHGQ